MHHVFFLIFKRYKVSVDGYFSVSLNDSHGSKNSENIKKEEELKKTIGIMILLIAHWTWAKETDVRISIVAENDSQGIVIPTTIQGDYLIATLSSEEEILMGEDFFYADGGNLYFRYERLEDLLKIEGSKTISLMFKNSEQLHSLKLRAVGLVTHDHKPLPRVIRMNVHEIGQYIIKIHNPRPGDEIAIKEMSFNEWDVEEYLKNLTFFGVESDTWEVDLLGWSTQDYVHYFKKLIKIKPYDYGRHQNKIWVLGFDREYTKYYKLIDEDLLRASRNNKNLYLRRLTFKYNSQTYEINIDKRTQENEYRYYFKHDRFEPGPNWSFQNFSKFKNELRLWLNNLEFDAPEGDDKDYFYKKFLNEYLEKNPQVKGVSFFVVEEGYSGRYRYAYTRQLSLNDFSEPFELYGMKTIPVRVKNSFELRALLKFIKESFESRMKYLDITFIIESDTAGADLSGVKFSKYGSYNFHFQTENLNRVHFGDGDYIFIGVKSFAQAVFGKGNYTFYESGDLSQAKLKGGDYFFKDVKSFSHMTFGSGNYAFFNSRGEKNVSNIKDSVFQNGNYYIGSLAKFKKITLGEGDFKIYVDDNLVVNPEDLKFSHSGVSGEIHFWDREQGEKINAENLFKGHKKIIYKYDD